jgi:cbb3-type cytochrome oxidase subunit 3
LRGGGRAAKACLVIAALLSLGYAAWAWTARRGIFADFSAGRTVTSQDARTSDRIDTVALIVTGVAVLAAVVWWVLRHARRHTAGSGLDLIGWGILAVGAVTVGVGLWMSGSVTDAATQAAEGDKGVTASLVTGAGFAVLALGLLLGSAGIRSKPDAGAPEGTGYPSPGVAQPWET